MVEIEIVEIGEQQLAEVNAISSLSDSQKQQVLAAVNFGSFSQKTQDVYAYLTEKLDESPTAFSVPAGVVAGILGLKYDTKDDRKNFKRSYLEKHDSSRTKWLELLKSQVVFQKPLTKFRNHEGDIVFDIPGDAEKKYVIGKKDGNRSQYIFMTPVYARFLITKGSGVVTKEFNEFLLKLHDEYVKFVKGQENELMAPVVKDERRELTNFEKMERRLDLVEKSVAVKQKVNTCLKDDISMLKEMNMLNDITKMYYVERIMQDTKQILPLDFDNSILSLKFSR